MRLDLHIHTNSSPDGFSTPRMVIYQAKRQGLCGVAITDHNTLKGIEAVKKVAPEGFFVIPGAEYSTDLGHMLVLFCDKSCEDFDINHKGLYSLMEIADFVHSEGGLLVAAHPFRYKNYLSIGCPYDLDPQMLQMVDGLESVNARDLYRDIAAKSVIEECAKEYGLFVTGGSDGHLPMEIGGGFTEFPNCNSNDELKEALLSFKTTAVGCPGKKIYMAASKIWRAIR